MLQFPTFKSLMEDCPACGERCNGKPVHFDNGIKAAWCFKGQEGTTLSGWSFSEGKNGCATVIAKTPEAIAQWDSITADSEGKTAAHRASVQGFGKKTKRVSAYYYVSQKAKTALVNELIALNYGAFGRTEAREDLLRRGLTKEQIIKYHFIDLNQQGHLPSRLNPVHYETVREWLGSQALRGIKKGSTWKKEHSLHGYLVPIFNYNGEICGFQRRFYPQYLKEQEAKYRHLDRLRKAQREGKRLYPEDLGILEQYEKKEFFLPGKYIWTKGITSGGKEVSAHLPINHELPLQTLKATAPCKTLLLTEGHMKPIVVYERLGAKFHVLGAAGGSFTSSPTILRHTLQAFVEEHNIQNVVWLADAGSYALAASDLLSETYFEYRTRREKELGLRVPLFSDSAVKPPTGETRKAAIRQLNEECAERTGKWADSNLLSGVALHKRPNIVGNIRKAKDFVERCGLSFSVADWGQLELEGEKDSLDPDVVDPTKILAALPSVPESTEINALDLFKGVRLNAFYNNFHRTVAFTFPKARYEQVVVQDKGDIPAVIARTHKKYIILNNPTGVGKSSIVHLFPFQEMGFSKHFYVSLTPRNPTTQEIESNFYSLEGRHGGLVIEPGKKTPNGLNVCRRPKQNEEPQTPANCAFFAEHNEARLSGLDGLGICKECPFLKECKSGEHEHYNYLYQHIQAKQQPQVRCAISALNPTAVDETTLITIDEPAQAAQPYEEVIFSVGDIAEYVSLINRKAGFEQGGLVVDSFCTLVPGRIQRESLLGLAASVDEDLKERKRILSRYKSRQRTLRPRAVRLVKLLLEGTSWRIQGDKFCAHVKNEHTLSILANAGKVIFLDATCTPEKFSVEYGVPLDDCLFITSEDRATENVSIVPLLTPHWGGRGQRDCEDKLNILDKTRGILKNKHGEENLGVITFSEYSQEGDISWFSESRGSNRFKEKTAILLTGLPHINVDVAKAHYALNRAGFEERGISENDYQSICLHEELKQAIGRIRGFYRTEQLFVYILCNASFPQLVAEGYTVNPSLLKDCGVDEANTPQLQSVDALIPAVTKLLEEGTKVTQQVLADAVGLAKQSVSRTIKRIGTTWDAFVDLAKQLITTPVPVPANKFFALTPELKEDVKRRKENVESQQLNILTTEHELASQDEVVQALRNLQEGWYPSGVRRNDFFYFQTALLSNLTSEFRLSERRQNMSIWDRIMEDWELTQIMEIEYGRNNLAI